MNLQPISRLWPRWLYRAPRSTDYCRIWMLITVVELILMSSAIFFRRVGSLANWQAQGRGEACGAMLESASIVLVFITSTIAGWIVVSIIREGPTVVKQVMLLLAVSCFALSLVRGVIWPILVLRASVAQKARMSALNSMTDRGPVWSFDDNLETGTRRAIVDGMQSEQRPMEPTLVAVSKPVKSRSPLSLEDNSVVVDPPVLGTWRRAPVPTLGVLPCGPAKLAYGEIDDVAINQEVAATRPPAMPLPVFPGEFPRSLG
mmetsp:Transcript_99822/g.229144  ORF Transcript_99822/g.229144 Transcript_99822/m.229144 type:complete len:260 (+) Transcript_99822:172-951(+)